MKKYLSLILTLCIMLTGATFMFTSQAVAATKPKATTISSVKAEVGGFTVKWAKVAETTGYQVQYSTKSNFSNAATVYGGGKNTTSKTITGRANGTKYYVRVRTYKNVNGSYIWGSWTASKAVTTPAKPGTASIASASGVTKGFTVKWKKVSGITGYQIQYSTKSNFSNAATVYGGAANATSKTITGRAVNTKYYVRVRAYKNINGNYLYGKWSAAKAVTTKNVSAPKATSIKSLSADVSNGFTVKWNKVAEATGYQIQYSTRNDFSNAATVYGGATNVTSKTITGRAAGTRYFVRVRTYKNANGSYVWGSWSPVRSVVPVAEVHCTNNNNHGPSCGNMGRWFNSKADVRLYVNSVMKEWSDKKDRGEITREEYIKNCPQGYECWSCGYCGKWTGNFTY